jgi:hypothetical protein
MMAFIGFTCHVVTKTFERYTLFLGVKRMIGRHTAENILAEYEQLLCDWEIDRSFGKYYNFIFTISARLLILFYF